MTASDNETPAARMLAWLTAGRAFWGTRIGGEWIEFPLYEAGAHDMAAVMERHLPERAA